MSKGPAQLTNKSAETVLIFNEDLRGVIISLIQLKFRSHSLVEVIATVLKNICKSSGTPYFPPSNFYI